MPEKTTVDLAFAVLEEAASKGRRCPTNLELAAEIASRGGARLAGQSMPGFLRVLAGRAHRRSDLCPQLASGDHLHRCTCRKKGRAHRRVETHPIS